MRNVCQLLCQANGMRQFHCHVMSCNGDHLVQQGGIDDQPELLPCNICSKLAPGDFEKGVFDNEQKHCVEKVADLGVPGDAANLILALQPPHTHHGTALRLHSAKSELLEHMGKLQQAIHLQQLWVDCRRQLHGDHCCDQRTGFGCEQLGDLLEKENGMLACEMAHQKPVQALQRCRGNSSDPLTMCAMKKLTTVQMQIQKSAGEKTSLSKSSGPICALCGIQDPNHKKCTRCKVGCCCNWDHQTVHWKVHKKTCCSGQQLVHMPS